MIICNLSKRKYRIVTYVTMTLRKICYNYHEAWSVVDFSCAMRVLFRKLGCCSRKEVSLFCFYWDMVIYGIIFKWG